MQKDEVQQQDRDALFGPSSRRPTSSLPPPRGTRAPGYNSNQLSGARPQRLAHQSFLSVGSNEFNSNQGGCSDAEADSVGVVWKGGESGHGRYGGRHEQQPQREQQQLSWAQVRDRIDVDERRRGLRSAHESAETGKATLESLQDQKERLERSEMVLDSTRYAIEQSARVLRGMNFWGKIANAFSEAPKIPESYNRSSTEAGRVSMDDTPAEGFICPDCRRNFHTPDGLVAHFESEHGGSGGGATSPTSLEQRRLKEPDFVAGNEEREARDGGAGNTVVGDGSTGSSSQSGSLKEQLFGGRAIEGDSIASGTGSEAGGQFSGAGGVVAEQKAVMAAQDAYLDEVGRAVTELGLLGRNIGASIEEQGNTLERVVEKTEESNDRAMFVTRKAARHAQSAKPKKPTFVMSVALQEVSSGLFMAVTGEDVVLRGKELRNVCRFEAWQRQEGIIGFKSSVTGRWLGQTFLGYLRVTGTSFSKNFEWQATLNRKETEMVCCSANWGAGGYLIARPLGGGERPPTPGDFGDNAPQETTSGVTAAELGLVDATIANKPRAAVFRVIDCEGYVAQPYVGGCLMRPPPPPSGRGLAEERNR